MPQETEASKDIYRKSSEDGQVSFKGAAAGTWLLQAQRKGYLPLEMVIHLETDVIVERILLKEKEFEAREKEAVELLKQGEFERAAEILTDLLELYPRDAVAHDNLARAYAGLLREEEALAEARTAAELDSRFDSTPLEVRRTILRSLGEEALQARNFPLAADRFHALVEIDPESPLAYQGLALAYGHQGHYKKALEFIDQALALSPGNSRLMQVKQLLLANAGVE